MMSQMPAPHNHKELNRRSETDFFPRPVSFRSFDFLDLSWHNISFSWANYGQLRIL